MCGIVGVAGMDRAAELAYLGLYALQHRGQEAAGISAADEHGRVRAGDPGDLLGLIDITPFRTTPAPICAA